MAKQRMNVWEFLDQNWWWVLLGTIAILDQLPRFINAIR